ncbi:MAG TPA: hypothetical protein VFM34_12420 [Moraxellaceae bacterium]|nr:hypothetical protein [Moraxellaceae bacterium]
MAAWLIFVLPLVAAALGALANFLSSRLLFGPLPFGGRFRPALVRNAGPVADRLAEGLGRTLHPGPLFQLMEPEKIAAAVAQAVIGRLDEHVDEIMRERNAVLWDNLPRAARMRVYSRVERQLPSIFDNLIDDLAIHMDELTDFQALLRDVIGQRQDLLAASLAEAMHEECRFLRRCGAFVGLILGGIQSFVWWQHPHAWWLIVTATAIPVMAVQFPRMLLYRHGAIPLSAHRAGEGLALVVSRRLAGDVFNARHLLHAVVTGPHASRARSLIRRHMRPLIETGLVRTTLQILFGVEAYAHIKQTVTERVTALTLDTLEGGYLDERQGARIEQACRERLQALPADEVRSLVQPLLDEGLWWRLVAVAGLGLLVGLLEVALFGGLSA